MARPFEKIIFVLGGGHSGSTLIDLIIGSGDEAFSVGELSYIDVYKGFKPGKSRDPNLKRLCTCGELFNECSFWSGLEFDPQGNIEKHDSLGESLRILTNTLNPFERWFGFSTKTSRNYQIYSQIYEEALKLKPKARYIVDSSKDPRRLFELVNDPLVGREKLAVIHLVRDGRGYVYSYQGSKRSKRGLRLPNTFLCALEWISINIIARLMIRKYDLDSYQLSYDVFAENPDVILNELGTFLDIELDSKSALARIATSTFHNVHGNPMRHGKIGSIKRSVPWKTEFSPMKRAVLSFFLYPFNRIWVYHRK